MRNNYGSTIVFKLVTKETTTVSIICKLETAAEYCGIESEPIYCKKLAKRVSEMASRPAATTGTGTTSAASTSASTTPASGTATSGTVTSGTTSTATTALTMMQNMMATAVQQAIPSLRESLSASLDEHIQTAMDQQAERMRLWLRSELPTDRSREGTGTSTATTGAELGASHGPAVTPPIPPSVPSGGNVVPANFLAGVPLMSAASTRPSTGSSSSAVTPHTPLAALLTSAEHEVVTSKSKKAIVIGSTSPPIPYKLADAIWRDEYIDLDELLPVRLGAPEPTLLELFSGHQKKQPVAKKCITTIEEWVMCFNAYIAVVAKKHPDRVADLLAYSSLIVKASRDYEDTPWLRYDQHYRRYAAAESPKQWGTIQPELWTLYFGRAVARQRCATCGDPGHGQCDGGGTPTSTAAGASLTQQSGGPQSSMARGKRGSRGEARSQPYARPPPICKRWNRPWGCRLPDCSFRHVCLECHGNHREPDCTQSKHRPSRPLPAASRGTDRAQH